ncbi:MAG: response regulator [Chloroflexi bacterium]|nr:response regulator [Chloroflexota bacterium]
MKKPKGRILIVGQDRELITNLSEILEGEYLTVDSGTFEDALSEILLGEFQMVITETRLPDLSGMDLLAVVGGLRPGTPVMIIDDDLSAKSAVAAMRLGACDYLHKPVNYQLLLMQIERQIETASKLRPVAAADAVDLGDKAHPSRNRERQINRATRPATLLLSREQFETINMELSTLLGHIRAHFVGLIDSEGNLAGAAGTLEDYDLVLLTRALSIDHSATDTLARILDENQFHAAYLEGEYSGVYIVEIREPFLLSLAVICSTEVKPGMVWLYTKRAAESIAVALRTINHDQGDSNVNIPAMSPNSS